MCPFEILPRSKGCVVVSNEICILVFAPTMQTIQQLSRSDSGAWYMYCTPFVCRACLSVQWICNFCKHEGPVPHAYQCPLDGAGLRRDRDQRAELCRGSVDFVVPKVRGARARHHAITPPGCSSCSGVGRQTRVMPSLLRY